MPLAPMPRRMRQMEAALHARIELGLAGRGRRQVEVNGADDDERGVGPRSCPETATDSSSRSGLLRSVR